MHGPPRPGGTVIDARRRLVTPGLINGHFHSHEHFHKGRYDNLPLELWMNYVRPPAPLPLTRRQVYLRTMIGAIVALRSGTTTLCDDMNVAPILQREHVEAALQAYEDIGVRAHLGITLFDRPYFRGVPFVDEEFPETLIESLSGREATPPRRGPEISPARWPAPGIRANAESPAWRRRRPRNGAPRSFSCESARWPTSSTCRS